jgi:hypothetical protein
MHQTYFSIGFLAEFFQQPLTIPDGHAKGLFQSVLDHFISCFNLRDMGFEPAQKQANSPPPYRFFGRAPKKPEPASSKLLSAISSKMATITNHVLYRFPSKAGALLAEVEKAVENWPTFYFSHLWLPFL